jgi:hypothetical protein
MNAESRWDRIFLIISSLRAEHLLAHVITDLDNTTTIHEKTYTPGLQITGYGKARQEEDGC